MSTEMVLLQLSGQDPSYGAVNVRLRPATSHPFLSTVGEIEESSNANPSLLEIAPFVTSPPNLCANSYFNVYFEVDLPDLGITLHNHAPKRMEGTIYHKPPRRGDPYVNYQFIPLDDQSDTLVALAGPGYHVPIPPEDPIELDLFPNSVARIDLRVPAGSPVPRIVDLTGPTAVRVDLGLIGDPDFDLLEQVSTEMVQLHLTGSHPSVGPVIVTRRMLSEHPFLPSTGEIEENNNFTPNVLDLPPFVTSPSGLTASSYFDVFFEVELPNLGLRLHTHQPKHMEATLRHKPPDRGGTYQNPLFIPLFDPSESIVAEIGPGFHVSNPGCPVICLDSDPCTIDYCDVLTGLCLNDPVQCNDFNPCTVDFCLPSDGGCTSQPGPDGNLCDDGNACTLGYFCIGGECTPGGPPLCDDANLCTDDGCDPATGCVYESNSLPCDDLDPCTSGDVCAGGQCHPGNSSGGGAYNASAWWANVKFLTKTQISWPPGSQVWSAVRGQIQQLRLTGNFGGEVGLQCHVIGTGINDPSVPPPNGGFYYLIRDESPCNRSFRTFHPRENPSFPTKRDGQITACP